MLRSMAVHTLHALSGGICGRQIDQLHGCFDIILNIYVCMLRSMAGHKILALQRADPCVGCL